MPKKELTLDSFAAYVDARPAGLGAWRDGAQGRYPTLAWLNMYPVAERRKLVSQVGPAAAAMISAVADHNRVGIAAGWVTQYMNGPSKRSRASHEDRVAMFNTAGVYWELRNALVEVRVGLRDFEVEGRTVRMPFTGNRRIDALDRMLEFVDRLESVPSRPYGIDSRLRNWLVDEGLARRWSALPGWVRNAFREQASSLLAGYTHYLSPESVVADVTIAEVDQFWLALLSWGLFMHAATILGSTHLPTISPLLPRDDFVSEIAADAGLDPSVVNRIVMLLTLDLTRCSDGGLTPLVPVDDCIVPMSSLILPNSPHRNLLAIVQQEPGRFGEVGRILGAAGEAAVAQVLRRLNPGAIITKRVKVLRRNGTHAGDLDIVVRDPKTKTGAVLEIKWGIAADGNAEVYRAERVAFEKRRQVLRLRKEVEEGAAVPRWPQGWPDMTGYTLRWFVLTRDVLAMRNIENDGVTIRSHQLLDRMLRKDASVSDLIALLDNPPVPPDDLCETEWSRFRYSDFRVEVENVAA